ncbi:MAG: hypothetical protein KDD41_03915 [Flavobacteriales bacterium]|nr:hypothetical protein [Flavobacteriales bacterium]
MNRKIRAFSVLEAMMAMLIVMIAFGLSSSIFINVSTSGFSPRKKKAHTLVNRMRYETLTQQRFIEESREFDGITIEKTISDYDGSSALKVLSVVAKSQDKTLFGTREIILINTLEP